MKALRWHGRGDLRYEEVADEGPPGPGRAVVEVAACGICGTDLHEYLAGPHLIRPDLHPLTDCKPPLALGHEMTGKVVALGSPHEGVRVGDRVAVDPCWSCGACRWCAMGEYHRCPRGGSVGLSSPGAFAERVTVPAGGLVRLPDEVTDEMAALAEPLAVGLHAVRRAGVAPGDNVLVYGAGPIGMAVLLAAGLAGAAGLYLSEPLGHRRAMARRLGVTEAFDPAAADVRREVYLRTGRVGPDAVIETTGRPDTTAQAVSAVRRGGQVVLAGIGSAPVQLDLTQLVFYERSIAGSLGYNFDIPRVIDLMAAGRIDVSWMVTGRYPLSAGPDVFAALTADRGHHLKVLLTPKET